MQREGREASLCSGRRNKIVARLLQRQRNKKKWDGQQTRVNQKGFGGFIWRQHVGMIMAILDPKGQPFILTLLRLAKLIIPPATPPEHPRPTTRQTAGGKKKKEMALWRSGIRQNNGRHSPPLQTQRDYLTFPGIHSICQPPLIPSLTKSSPLHLWDYPSFSLCLQSD